MKPESLFHGCANHDEAAWEYAYNYVLNYLEKKFTRPGAVSLQDVAQDVFVYFIDKRIKKVASPRAFKQLLRTKAWQVYFDHWRKNTRHPVSSIEEGIEHNLTDADPGIEKNLIAKEVLSFLLDAIKLLPGDCNRILQYYFEGRLNGDAVKETAKKMDLTSNNFSVKVSRCFQHLRQIPDVCDVFSNLKRLK